MNIGIENLTPKQQTIVVRKLQGKKRKEIAAEVYPNQKEESGIASVSRVLRKATVQAAVHAELINQGITLETVIKPLKKALNAKIKHYETETTETGKGKDRVIERKVIVTEEDNIPLQLQGYDRAAELMGIGKSAHLDGDTGLTPDELSVLAGEADEMVLTQLLFRKQG